MSRLALSHDDSISHLESMAFRTFLMEAEAPSMIAGREAGQAYHTAVTAQQTMAEKPEAPPHIYIGMAVIKRLLEYPASQKEGYGVQSENLKQYHQDLVDSTPMDSIMLLPFFRINKTYTEGFRVRLNCQTEAQTASVSWFLCEMEEAAEKRGKAPKGRLARDLIKQLEK